MAGLPADSIYRETERVSLIGAIAELLQRASAAHEQQHHQEPGEAKKVERLIDRQAA